MAILDEQNGGRLLMAVQHKCGDEWKDGRARECGSPNHKHGDKPRIPFREGVKERRRADRQAGVIGQDRGSYINGGEGGF